MIYCSNSIDIEEKKRMNIRIDGVIINAYGILLHTEIQKLRAWQKALEEKGLSGGDDLLVNSEGKTPSPEETLRIIRKFDPLLEYGTQAKLEYLESLCGNAGTAQEILKNQREIYLKEKVAGELESVSGADYLLEKLLNSGIPFIAVSINNTKKLREDLENAGIDNLKGKLYRPYRNRRLKAGDFIEKSSPDFYADCARKMFVESRNCAVIENTLLGALSSAAAGAGITFLYDALDIFRETGASVLGLPENVEIIDSLEVIADRITGAVNPRLAAFVPARNRRRNLLITGKALRIAERTTSPAVNRTLSFKASENLKNTIGMNGIPPKIMNFPCGKDKKPF